jgi:hypothetical protein
MFRRLMSAVVLLTGLGFYAFAAERATFILTDGERKSGPVVFHGDQHENLINGFLNLGADNGKEMTFPVNQVAVIDFVGGQPPTTELAQLGTVHMLVTRDGTTQQGRLINLIGGDTLIWENLANQRQQFAIRDVSRVYLNPASARTAFNYAAPVAPPETAPPPTSNGRTARADPNRGNQADQGDQGAGRNRRDRASRDGQGSRGDQSSRGNQRDRRDEDTSARGVTVRVDGRQQWTDSGLTVTRGERLVFEASVPTRGLLGRIGNGSTFVIDTEQPLAMRDSGRLMLGVSDDDSRSRSGAFSVIVSRP